MGARYIECEQDTKAPGTAAGLTLICTARCDDSRAKPTRTDRLALPVDIAQEFVTKQKKLTDTTFGEVSMTVGTMEGRCVGRGLAHSIDRLIPIARRLQWFRKSMEKNPPIPSLPSPLRCRCAAVPPS